MFNSRWFWIIYRGNPERNLCMLIFQTVHQIWVFETIDQRLALKLPVHHSSLVNVISKINLCTQGLYFWRKDIFAGDPNDKSLRKVEKDVVIMQKVRERTKAEKCQEEWRGLQIYFILCFKRLVYRVFQINVVFISAFGDCAKESGLLLPFLCRKENTIMRACSERWYKDENFVKECTEQYLEERSEYRRTGITKRQKQFANRMAGGLT